MTISWVESGTTRIARWQSEANVIAPKRVLVVDDSINADTAYRLACEGSAMLWRGDFHNARQLLQAMARRCDQKKIAKKSPLIDSPQDLKHLFNLHRVAQAQRARILGMLLIEVSEDYQISLNRAPDFKQAFIEAYGEFSKVFVTSLRELQGLVGREREGSFPQREAHTCQQ